jgi:rare lipoprotein A
MLTDSSYYYVEGGSSYYGKRFHNRRTSSGQRFDMNKFTAASRNLPFGTIVRVTNLNSNKTSLAIINDRGPFIRKRIIDISSRIAKEIGSTGIPPVRISSITNVNHPDSSYFSGRYIAFPLLSDVQLADYIDINFMKQMTDFSEAVELIHTLQEMNPNVPYCLAVSANEYFSTRFERTYYVGILLHVMKSESLVIN